MNETIDLTDKSKWADGWQTQNGKATAEIIKRLSDGRFAVVLTDGDGDQWVGTRFPDGRCWPGCEDEYDLIPRPKKHSGWLAIAVNDEQRYIADFLATDIYSTKDLARIQAESRRWTPLAIIPVTFTEGEGLEGVK